MDGNGTLVEKIQVSERFPEKITILPETYATMVGHVCMWGCLVFTYLAKVLVNPLLSPYMMFRAGPPNLEVKVIYLNKMFLLSLN